MRTKNLITTLIPKRSKCLTSEGTRIEELVEAASRAVRTNDVRLIRGDGREINPRKPVRLGSAVGDRKGCAILPEAQAVQPKPPVKAR